jgi:hypothetical protein
MNKSLAALVVASVLALSFLTPAISFAQSSDATSLTITPPFFELNVDPGDAWSSAIRVVNTNAADLPVHATVMGFGAADDLGHGSFTPLSALAGDADALANWITISTSSLTVSRGGATDIPFSIVVPPNASPGGHYAAVLIGTGTPGGQPGVSQVGVSSFISALIFVRVSGNVIESGQIQSFSSDHSYYQSPDVHFSVRFQNTGNVHIRPIGDIEIYNAFGKEKGVIPINGEGNLGYVLPSSSREFDLEWQGQPSLLDIGPYTAVVSLAYGEDGTKSTSETIGFWVVPIDQMLEVLFGVLAVASIFTFILKRLVRKMLSKEISKYGGAEPVHPPSRSVPRPSHEAKRSPPAPADEKVLDLRDRKDK